MQTDRDTENLESQGISNSQGNFKIHRKNLGIHKNFLNSHGKVRGKKWNKVKFIKWLREEKNQEIHQMIKKNPRYLTSDCWNKSQNLSNDWENK